jgi:phosphodiesterase/alkaline phosphatase D-like protein/2',3'-cyclic-nucleotide 2'-phosphodiesterase (5'-nucleotidase family)
LIRFRSLFSFLLLVLLVGTTGSIPASTAASATPHTSAPADAHAPTHHAATTDAQQATPGATPRAALQTTPSIALKPIGRFKGEGAEIVAYDPTSQRIFITNGTGAIDVVSIADPTAPELVNSVNIATEIPIYGTPPYEGATANSVAVKNGIVAVAIADDAIGAFDPIAFFDVDGNPLGSVGAANYPDSLPDMITFTPDGTKLLVANEGEPVNEYLEETDGSINDPEGSVSIIDVSGIDADTGTFNVTSADVTTVDFRDFNAGAPRASELPDEVRIFGPQATVAQDLEPEYITISDDSTTAWVTLQENNAVAVIGIDTASVAAIAALGTKDHSQEDNAMDASNEDGEINIQTWPTKGMYQPDAIASYNVDGDTYLVTANEGDARDYDGFSEEARVADLTLDAGAFPDAEALQAEDQLGRLNTTTVNGDTDGDGEFEEIYSYGARSMSIWNANGELVFDTGDHIGRTIAARYPDYFNGQFDDEEDVFVFDNRSDDKGAEPEGVTTGTIDGRTYAFLGLERMGGVMVFDVTNPEAPTFVQYINTTNFTGSLADDTAGNVSPEGLAFIAAEDSPSGKPLLVVTYEVSTSTAIFEISQAAASLTVLHNNDGESSLLPLEYGVPDPANPEGDPLLLPVGGVAAFKSVQEREIADARASGNAVLNVYAGDAFLASATLQCTLQDEDGPFYDAVAQRQMPYDAHIIGNHEFDFSPDTLERFIRDFATDGELTQPFLAGNLDFSKEPGFADLVDEDGLIVDPVTDGRVVGGSYIVTDEATGEQFGIVGMAPYYLRTISSPRDVKITATNLVTVTQETQEEVDRLVAEGINKIILVSHLQDIAEDQQLIPQLRHVDVAVAGGGDELLVNSGVAQDMQLLPGEEAPIDGEYPIIVQDADGRDVPIVTTAGNYKYVGRLDVAFDEAGEVTSVITDKSYPRPVIPESDVATTLNLDDTVPPDAGIVTSVNEPVEACLSQFDDALVRSEVVLDVSRNGSRGRETNAGNMVADSYIYAYQQLATANDLPPISNENPVIAVQNGGGIRQNAGDVLPVGGIVPGSISRRNTLDVLAFFNFMTAVQEVPPEDLKAIFERAASRIGGGQFLQVSGLRVVYDVNQPAQQIAENGTVTAEGSRVVSLVLNDGTPIVQDGQVVAGAPSVTIVTNSFTAGGGDNYPWLGNNANKTQMFDGAGLPLTYQEVWVDYMLTFPVEEGFPTIQASDPRYQPSGDGRISFGGQYVKPTTPGVQFDALLTVGETTGRTSDFDQDFRMVGIPDGLGAYRADDGNVRLFMNHELNNDVVSAPIVGSAPYTGSIISEFVLGGGTPGVQSGDLAFEDVYAWDGTDFISKTAAWRSGAQSFARFCSGYLAGPHEGYPTLPEYIYLAGEETAAAFGTFDEFGGQAVAVADGTLYALADMGRFAKENVVVAPTPDADPNLTFVLLLEDGPSSLDSQLYVYVGTKQPDSANPIERAGLVGGELYFFRSTVTTRTDELTFGKEDGVLTGEWVSVESVLEPGEEVWNLLDETLNERVQAANPFNVIRVEDAAYDPSNPGVVYFTTTGSDFQVPEDSGTFPNNLGRLNRLTFDPANPIGGTAPTLEVLLEGDAGDPVVNPDNIAINTDGQIMIQEDPNGDHRGDFLSGETVTGRNRAAGDSSIWLYDLEDESLVRVGEVDQTVVPEEMRGEFGSWETSGIIDASHLYGPGSWLLDVQAHSISSEQASQLVGAEEDLQVVEGGQLLVMQTSNASVTSIGAGGGSATSADASITVEFPAGAVPDGSTVFVSVRLDRPVLPGLSKPVTDTLSFFQIEVLGPDNTPITELGELVTVTVDLSAYAEAIESKRLSMSGLAPVFWDGNAWTDPTSYPPCRLQPALPGCTWSLEGSVLTLRLDHFSDFALVGQSSRVSGSGVLFLPVILGPAGTSAPAVGNDSSIQGIASGDTTATSTMLWAHTSAQGDVTFEYDTSSGFENAQRVTAAATNSLLPVKVAIEGLQPGTTYSYRVTDAEGAVATGTFRTAAAAGTPAGLRFGVSGDWRGELSPYPAISNVAGQNLDFFILHGDTIYADYPSPDVPAAQATTIEEYRQKHAEVYGTRYDMNTWAAVRASTSVMATIDDHEVTNDFAGGAAPSTDERFLPSDAAYINDTELYEIGLQAFQEYNPIRDEFYGDTGDPRTAEERKLYRFATYGSDAAIFLLDNRSFRDPHIENITDLTDVSQLTAFFAAAYDPTRTMLGQPQLADLKNDLRTAHESGITWKFVIVPEPMQNFGPVEAADRFEGYAAERTEILKFIDDNDIKNVVFVAADFHGTVVNNIFYQVPPNVGPTAPQVETDMFEVVTGAVAFDEPFGPTVVQLAADLGLLTEPQKAVYDSLNTLQEKDAFFKELANQAMTAVGYDPLGLEGSQIDFDLLQGDWVVAHTYGWTEFVIDAATQVLTITTYGIEAYSQAELEADPEAIKSRTPTIYQQFTVTPK